MNEKPFNILPEDALKGLSRDELVAYASRLGSHAAKVETQVGKLRRTTYLDAVTGLRNRHYFDETLEREFSAALKSGKPLSLVIGDIDHFKTYNDTVNHLFGDFVLRLVADAVAGSVHEDTDSVCRAGGEEIALVLPYTSLDGATALAESVRKRVEEIDIHKELSGGISYNGSETIRMKAANLLEMIEKKPLAEWPARVTMSFGVGAYPYNGVKNALGLYRVTDDACVKAKYAGRNRVESIRDLNIL